MTTYDDPLSSMVNKIKANSYVRTLLPSYNNVFDQFMPENPTVPGIYITQFMGDEEPILGFNTTTNPLLLSNNSKWQLDALHNLSLEHAKKLGYTACRSLLPSITTAGLFSLKYSLDAAFKDGNYGSDVYRATFTITCPSQHIVIEI